MCNRVVFRAWGQVEWFKLCGNLPTSENWFHTVLDSPVSISFLSCRDVNKRLNFTYEGSSWYREPQSSIRLCQHIIPHLCMSFWWPTTSPASKYILLYRLRRKLLGCAALALGRGPWKFSEAITPITGWKRNNTLFTCTTSCTSRIKQLQHTCEKYKNCSSSTLFSFYVSYKVSTK